MGKSFGSFLILFVFMPLSTLAQDSSYVDPRGLYIQPLYTLEVMSSNAPNLNDYYLLGLFNLNAFKVWGAEIGYYKGATSYGLQIKYRTSIIHYDWNNGDGISG